MFMARGTLAPFQGTIRNPFAGALDSVAVESLLGAIPDTALVRHLMSGADVSFAATAEDLALWAAASRDWRGIDPKRPFGTGNVSRDLRALLDPARKLPSGTFFRRRKLAEARLVMMLQLFVQRAELAVGDYERDHLFNWLPAESLSGTPERLTAAAWADRVAGELYYKLDDANRTLAALRHLADDGRLSGGYAVLASQFRLSEIFARDWHATYEGEPVAYLDAGLQHFPDVATAAAPCPLTLMRARLHNFFGEFQAASALINAGNLSAPELPLTREVSLSALAALEALIARHGTGALDGQTFDEALNAWIGGGPGDCLRDWTRDLLDAERDDGADVYTWRLMQAAAAQLLLMSSLVG
jgi:hypothetical protein